MRYSAGEDPKCVHNVKMEKPVEITEFSPDSRVIAVVSGDRLFFYDAKTAKLVDSVSRPHEGMHIVDLSDPSSCILLVLPSVSALDVRREGIGSVVVA